MSFNHSIAKNIGKVGLLGAGEMALNHFWPDNPVAASREKGYDTIKSLGLDINGAISGIESTPAKVAAMLGQGLLVAPAVTAFGAGNWVGDKISKTFNTDGNTKVKNRTRGGYTPKKQKGLING